MSRLMHSEMPLMGTKERLLAQEELARISSIPLVPNIRFNWAVKAEKITADFESDETPEI